MAPGYPPSPHRVGRVGNNTMLRTVCTPRSTPEGRAKTGAKCLRVMDVWTMHALASPTLQTPKRFKLC
eukprot:4241338-Amphidinium_carterae.1